MLVSHKDQCTISLPWDFRQHRCCSFVQVFEYYGTAELLSLDVRMNGQGREQQPVPLGTPRMYTE
jgi:hypothetical protein